jgi:NAD(P)-dependent dehydrogenase (short-subunit alcohol dehydrogenase family)
MTAMNRPCGSIAFCFERGELVSGASSVLNDKRVLLTGATGGVGRELATRFAMAGARLMLLGRQERVLMALKRELDARERRKDKVLVRALDLASTRDLDDLTKFVDEFWGGIDVLVNCAGVFPVTPLESSNVEEFDRTFDINVRAPFLLCQAFVPGMAQRAWGRVINVASSSAYGGFRNTSVYCASKHALLGLSRALFDEYRGRNVRTICVSPGSIKTEMGRRVANQDFDTFLEPSEVAQFIVDLASMDGSMISEEVRLNRMVIR